MNNSGANAVKRILEIMTSRRWAIGVLAALGGGLSARRDSAAFFPSRQQAGNYKGRSISYGERDGALVLEIDGQPVDTIARLEPKVAEPIPGLDVAGTPVILQAERYSSTIFPFRTYASPDDIARATINNDRRLFYLP